jgi:hypothetical protein
MDEVIRIACEERDARLNIELTPWRPPSPEA